jgi:hypothetical protein
MPLLSFKFCKDSCPTPHPSTLSVPQGFGLSIDWLEDEQVSMLRDRSSYLNLGTHEIVCIAKHLWINLKVSLSVLNIDLLASRSG